MTLDPPKAEGHLPLKPVVFHILLALAEGKSHGYGVIRCVRRRSEGLVDLQTGAFYRHLRRLLDGGLVEEAGGPRPADDPRRGAYYRLTDLGREVMRAEWHRMASLVALTRQLGITADGERA